MFISYFNGTIILLYLAIIKKCKSLTPHTHGLIRSGVCETNRFINRKVTQRPQRYGVCHNVLQGWPDPTDTVVHLQTYLQAIRLRFTGIGYGSSAPTTAQAQNLPNCTHSVDNTRSQVDQAQPKDLHVGDALPFRRSVTEGGHPRYRCMKLSFIYINETGKLYLRVLDRAL